jgi:BTB/POZ domain
MRKLKAISIRNNKLKTLSSNLLKPLERNGLKIVDLRGNTRVNAFYRPGTIGSFDSVQQLAQEIDVKCDKAVEDKAASQTKTKPTMINETFAEKFQYLLTSGNFSDFLIIAGVKQFKVHKCVLSIQSPTLTTLFAKEKELAEMSIEDFTAEAVEKLIEYIYSGELLGELHAIELFGLASDLQIPELRAKCEKIILTKIDQTNAENIFALSHRYGSEDMRNLAMNEIKKMFPGIDFPNEVLNNPAHLKDIIEAKRKSETAKNQLETKLSQYGIDMSF